MRTVLDVDVNRARRPAHPVQEIFVHRWSPRAMSGEELAPEELMGLFEAARWAPSSYNNQPWRFIYARRNTRYWNAFLDLLQEANRSWAKRAGALVVIASKQSFDFNGQPARTHTFDSGAAWAQLALQASAQGLVAHGMEGFDYAKAQALVSLPEGYSVEAMAAIGRPGRVEDLPENLRARETPSDRRPMSEFVFEGKFQPAD